MKSTRIYCTYGYETKGHKALTSCRRRQRRENQFFLEGNYQNNDLTISTVSHQPLFVLLSFVSYPEKAHRPTQSLLRAAACLLSQPPFKLFDVLICFHLRAHTSVLQTHIRPGSPPSLGSALWVCLNLTAAKKTFERKNGKVMLCCFFHFPIREGRLDMWNCLMSTAHMYIHTSCSVSLPLNPLKAKVGCFYPFYFIDLSLSNIYRGLLKCGISPITVVWSVF